MTQCPCCKLLNQWVQEKRVGSVTINFFKGGISSINMNETKKPEELGITIKEKDRRF